MLSKAKVIGVNKIAITKPVVRKFRKVMMLLRYKNYLNHKFFYVKRFFFADHKNVQDKVYNDIM